ncbi:MAG TPA: suppressor of fused domain protein [Puia sp.]|nr:suppressor of fused domain protein [Puia sp.]
MNLFKKLFGKKETPRDMAAEERHYELKEAGLEKVLGPSHPLVGHAIIPFEVGGAVDMYYYPNHIKGTGFATMELIKADGSGPVPNRMGTYELVAFTKHDYAGDGEGDNAFNLIERRVCGIFTSIGNYSFEAKLKPGDTCEVPGDDEPNRCIVFDEYNPDGKAFYIGDRKHGLLLVIEIFQQEMDYARQHGSANLLGKLKENGYYPYSDMDREAVV